MRALLNYPGGKWGLAEEIVALFPRHRTYLEPFFGSGAVFFTKPPSAIETINDLDGDIVNFFTVMRDSPEELARLIALTPYSREIFNDAHADKGNDPIDRAYRFAIRSRMGHGFKTYTKTGFKTDIAGREGAYALSNWVRMPRQVLDMAERLRQAQIEQRPAVELIRRYNFENVLIYADPPYLMETRGGKQYNCEMTEQDHVELLAALKEHKGPVVLSGYPSELYDRELSGWARSTRRTYNQKKDPRTEVLWCNFDIPLDWAEQEGRKWLEE